MIDDALEYGEQCTITRVTDPAFDSNDVLDESASTTETETVNCIASSPSEDKLKRLEGQVSSKSVELTVPSSTDVVANRNGISDEVDYNGDTYSVSDVQTVEHPFAGVVKKQIIATKGR